VRYHVYVTVPGLAGILKQATVRSDGATLSGLRPGTYLARVVPANLRQDTGPAAQVTFTVP